MKYIPTIGTKTCGFCGKSSTEVRLIVCGPHCGICDECAEVLLFAFEEAGIRLASIATIDADSHDEIKRLQTEIEELQEMNNRLRGAVRRAMSDQRDEN